MKEFFAMTLILILSAGAFGATNLASLICEPGVAPVRIASGWKAEKSKKHDQVCASAICKNDKLEYERIKCIREQVKGQENTVVVSYTSLISQSNSFKSMSSVEWHTINKEDQCFDACKPGKQGSKTVAGLERESCMECFQNRGYRGKEDLNYPEIGKMIDAGSKCYKACQDKPGPIVSERVLSIECQQCVGFNKANKEQFYYVLTQKGECLEIDKNLVRYKVKEEVCKKAPGLIHTYYAKGKTIQSWVSGGESHCNELDEETGGQIFKARVLLSKCEASSINDADRNLFSDRPATGTKKISSPKGSSNQ